MTSDRTLPLPVTATGVFSHKDLRRIGHDARSVRRLLRGGQITRLLHGWYCAGSPADPGATHRLKTAAAAALYGSRGAPSHHSRLLLEGLPTWQADLSVVALTRTSGTSNRSTPHLVVHRPPTGLKVAEGTDLTRFRWLLR